MDNPWYISVRVDTYHARRRELFPWLMESAIIITIATTLHFFFVNLLDWELQRSLSLILIII